MSKPRVIQADYASWRPVAGRKVLQLVFEVPIEQTEQVMQMLGVPMPGESKWCAIALLENGSCVSGSVGGKVSQTPKLSEATEQPATRRGNEPSPINANSVAAGILAIQEKERTPFNELPETKQAAIRCADPDFQTFIKATNEEEAATAVRRWCGVKSRADLNFNEEGQALWQRLEDTYQKHRTTKQYEGVRR